MKGNSRVQALIFFDGLDDISFGKSYKFVSDLRQGILSALQKSFTEPIVSDPGDILIVFSGRSLRLAKTWGFDPFLNVTILLLKEGEYLNWDLLIQLDKEVLAAVVLKWLQMIGVKAKTMVLFQWRQADHVNILSMASESYRTHNYVDPALLITAGSILTV